MTPTAHGRSAGGPRGVRGRKALPGSTSPVVITDAHAAASQELAQRQRRYAITMAFRTACFLAMIWVPGPGRWVLFGCAVFLPYVAVILANQANQRGQSFDPTRPFPSDAPQLTTGAEPDVTERVSAPQPGRDDHDRVG